MTKPTEDSFLAKISALTSRLRRIATDTEKLAGELEDVALESSRQTEQFEQLRKLLKSID